MRSNRRYNPCPFVKMTDRDTVRFASRVAIEALESIPMNQDEMSRFASAVYFSIKYFNDRSAAHAEYMRYLRECEAERQLAEKQKEEEKKKRKELQIFIN